MDIQTLQAAVWNVAAEHGWVNPDTRSFGDKIALIHSELSEALEEFRAGHAPSETYYGADGKPEGIPAELADVVIRVLELCENEGINLEGILMEKHEYNRTRSYRHGGKVI